MSSVLIISSTCKSRIAANIDRTSLVATASPVLGLILYVLLILVNIIQSNVIKGRCPACSKDVLILCPLIKFRSQITLIKSFLDRVSWLNSLVSTTCKNSSENEMKSMGDVSKLLGSTVLLFLNGLILRLALLNSFYVEVAAGATYFLGGEVLDDGGTLFYLYVLVVVPGLDTFAEATAVAP